MDRERLLNVAFEELEHSYSSRDTILYALGVGLGHDPLDSGQLRYVFESNLQVVPSMGVVLAHPGFWLRERDTGVRWEKVLHVSQDLVIHEPLLPADTVVARTRVIDVVDKGIDKGALITYGRTIRRKATGEDLCTVTQTVLARGDGGCGGPQRPAEKPRAMPDGEPSITVDLPTLAQAALIYRLSGDYNPLHVDPGTARVAGFDRPILQGLCTFGIACHALLRTCCGYEATRLRGMRARFSGIVYPGETIRTEVWRDGTAVAFRCTALDRGIVVLNNGFAELASG